MIASGFSVSGAIPRRCAASSSVTPASRSGVSASSASFARRERVHLGAGLAACLLLGLLERAVDHAEVGEQQFASHGLEFVGRRSVPAEAAQHHGERVHLAQLRDALGARHAAGDVHEPNLRRDGLLRRLHVGEHLQARIGHRHDRDVGLAALRTRARHRGEQRALPAERHADESDVLHGRRA